MRPGNVIEMPGVDQSIVRPPAVNFTLGVLPYVLLMLVSGLISAGLIHTYQERAGTVCGDATNKKP